MGKIAASKLINFYIVIFSIIIMAFIALGTFSSYFDPRVHNVIPFIGLLLPALLVINLFNCIYLAFTKRKIFSCFAATAFIIGFIGAGYKIPGFFSTKTSMADKHIRVMTFNMGENKAGSKKFDNLMEIIKFIESENVDVLCIQEYPKNSDIGETLKGSLNFLPFQTITETDNKELRVAVFSRFPIQNIKHLPFYYSNNKAISADLLIKNKIIKLLCAHLQTTNLSKKNIRQIWSIPSDFIETIDNMNTNMKIRAMQANLISNEIQSSKYPVLFCGDMNDTPTSYTYKKIREGLKDGFEECGHGIGYTYHGFCRLLRIDYILYSEDFTGINYISANKPFSDHNPVIMDLVLH